MPQLDDIVWFDDLTSDQALYVGQKNANLGEATRALKGNDIQVPPGFALNAQVYRDFLQYNGLHEAFSDHVSRLTRRKQSLAETGAALRGLIRSGDFSPKQIRSIEEAFERLASLVRGNGSDDPIRLAVRSSALADDNPNATFAGKHDSFLNVIELDAVIHAIRACFASLYSDRAIAYRKQEGFNQLSVAMSVGIQIMVRSDLSCAGQLHTWDPDSGFPEVTFIQSVHGLGPSAINGLDGPDRFTVFKPLLKTPFRPIIERHCGDKPDKIVYPKTGQSVLTQATTDTERQTLTLTDDEVLELTRCSRTIEHHFKQAVRIEWAKAGPEGPLQLLQVDPMSPEFRTRPSSIYNYKLKEKGQVLIEGASVGRSIASGPVFRLSHPIRADRFPEGAILVTDRTDPDWVPIMRRASAIITNGGGATSHAAIVSRELEVPAVVGTRLATRILPDDQLLTVDCSEGPTGKVYRGRLNYEMRHVRAEEMAPTRTNLMINVALPDHAMQWWQLPARGIGLARIEFIVSSHIGIHPMALLHPERMQDRKTLARIRELTKAYDPMPEYFVDRLATGIARIAAACYPDPAMVRFSDFKSNEYRGLMGGADFGIDEANPMLGLRGASRYYHGNYKAAFELECQALKRAREIMGFDNIMAMIPFCRTPDEADEVLAIMADAGLRRGEGGLQIHVMCEIPANVILAKEFADRFDGLSIGSNDLTQLMLGVDRDSTELSHLFNPCNEAVKQTVAQLIKIAHEQDRAVNICGQAPSDYPEFAHFITQCGIDAISLNPDTIVPVSQVIANAEKDSEPFQKSAG